LRTRIAQVTLRFTPPGGIVTVVREMARRLRAEGDEVEVFASDRAVLSPSDHTKDLSREVDGITVHRFPVRDAPFGNLNLGWLTGLTKALAESGVDVIHAHNHRLAHVLEAALASKRSGIPLVVTTYFHPAQRDERWPKRAMIRLADYGFGASAYLVARAIIVQSEMEARLVGSFAPRGHIRIIPHGLDLAEWEHPEGDRPDGLQLPPEYFLYAGLVVRRKGIDHLIEALSRLSVSERRPLVILGRDLGERPAFQAMARRFGVADSILWCDPLPRSTYRAVVRGATALVLPSEWETFGLVLLDAMAARTPVIATRRGGMSEVLEDGRSGLLVPYGNPDALAGALRSVIADPVSTRTRVDHGSDHVAQMDWSTIARQYHALYREVADL